MPTDPLTEITQGGSNDALLEHYSLKNGVDPELARRLLKQESRGRSRAVSPKGAMGLMQLMPGTARQLGVTDPFDVHQNLDAGTKYLRQQLDEFGDPHLALAAYNAGPGAVKKFGNKIPPYRETQNYVKTIGAGYEGTGYAQDPLTEITQAKTLLRSPEPSNPDIDPLTEIVSPQTPSIAPPATGRFAGMAVSPVRRSRGGQVRPVRPLAQGVTSGAGGGQVQPRGGVGELRRLDDPETARIIRVQRQITNEQTPDERAARMAPGASNARLLEPPISEQDEVIRRVTEEQKAEAEQRQLEAQRPKIDALKKKFKEFAGEGHGARLIESMQGFLANSGVQAGNLINAATIGRRGQGLINEMRLAQVALAELEKEDPNKGWLAAAERTLPGAAGELAKMSMLSRVPVAGRATLPGLGALSEADKGPEATMRGAAEGELFHRGFEAIAPLSRSAKFAVGTSVPAAMAIAQGEDPKKAILSNTAFGALAAMGEAPKEGLRNEAQTKAIDATRAPMELATTPEAITQEVGQKAAAGQGDSGAASVQISSDAGSVLRADASVVVRHSDPRIDGGEVIGRTGDGKLKVQNNEGGISTIKNPRGEGGNRDAAIVKTSQPVESASQPAEVQPEGAASVAPIPETKALGPAIPKDANLTEASQSGSTIYFEFDGMKPVPTAEQMKGVLSAQGVDASVVRYEPNIVSGARGTVRFRADIRDEQGRMSSKAAETIYERVFGTKDRVSGKTTLSGILSPEEQFKLGVSVSKAQDLGAPIVDPRETTAQIAPPTQGEAKPAPVSQVEPKPSGEASIRSSADVKVAIQKHFNLPEDQADAVSRIADARAETWAKQSGKPKEEWYASRIADITEGEPGKGALYQEGGSPFYSQLSRVVDQKMPNRSSPEQLKAMLESPQSGVKADEIKWTGLDDFLQGKRTVSKQEVQDFLKQNQVEVKEVTKGGARRVEKQGNTWAVLDPDGTVHARLGRQDEARAIAEGTTTPTKFEKFQLPGGENYRELLLTLPRASEPMQYPDRLTELPEGWRTSVDRSQPSDHRYAVIPAGQIHGRPFFGRYASPEIAIEKAVEQLNSQRNVKYANEWRSRNESTSFTSSHFDEPNILAHVRFNDRVVDGKKVLFIEEVQSDWHQKGRSEGYGERPRWAFKDAKNTIIGSEFASRAEAEIAAKQHPGYRPTWSVIEQQSRASVPDAPFKKTWHELAMKRMLRYAAENGYDRVAWTTGEQQAERYDLSKQVDEVRYFPEGGRLFAFKNGSLLIEKEDVSTSKVADYIGKDAAEKLLKSPRTGEPDMGRYHSLAGSDLKVGGEGMKGFYDQILPSFMNRYGKKWGARVERSSIPTERYTMLSAADIQRAIDAAERVGDKATANTLGHDLDAINAGAERRLSDYPSDSPRRKYLPPEIDSAPVHSLDITPSMKQSVMEGQPLFQGNKASTEFLSDNRAIIRGLQAPDISSAAHEFAHVFRRDLEGTLLKSAEQWAGVPRSGKWETVHEEKFARGFERYLREGKAPTEQLRQVFQQFKEWLTNIYAKIKGSPIEGKLSPEIRSVFDEMLGKESPKAEAVAPQTKQPESALNREPPGGFTEADRVPPKVSREDELRARYEPGNPFADKAARARAAYERVAGPSARDKAMGEAFPLGGGFAHGSERSQNRRIDSSVNRAVKAVETLKEAQYREAQAEAYDKGEINAQGRRPAKNADEAHDKRLARKEETEAAKALRKGKETWEVSRDTYLKSSMYRSGPGAELVKNDHYEAVADALKEGKTPYEGWQKDYPDLANKFATQTKEAETAAVRDARSVGKTIKGLPRVFKLEKTSKTLFQLRKEGEQIGVIQRVGDKQWRVANSELPRFNTPEEAATAVAQSMGATVKPGRGEAGAVDVDLLTLGVRPFAKDVAAKGREVAAGTREISNGIRSLLAPPSRSEQALQTSRIVRANAAEMTRAHDIADRSLSGARQFFAKQKPESNYDFIDKMERGQPQADPKTQKFADTFRQMLDERRDQIRALGTGKLDQFIEDYFPHVWKDPKKASDAFASAASKRPFEGSRAFLKKRTLPLTSDGLALGLEPVSNNPVDLAVLKLREMDRYLMAHKVMGEMKDQGNLKFFKVSEKLPDGWAQIDDKVATVFSRSEKGELILRGRYAAPESAAKIINNYLSPGLNATAFRVPFKAWRATSNLMNQFQLGFSAFHAGFTTLDTMISRTAAGLEDVFRHGKPLRGIATIASTPLAPVTNFIRGSRMLREWYEPGTQGSEIGRLVQAMQEGGGRARMDQFYSNSAVQKFTDALRQGNILGAALRSPAATIEAFSKPIMEQLVPRQKMGVFADMARRELERLGPDASEAQRRHAMAKAWDSTDSRLGQMVYDNLFWNKITKDLAMASVRSVGWNLGTAREVVGGATDYASLPIRAMKRGRTEPLFTHRMAYAAALPMVVGTLGAMTQYLMTGKGPQEAKDYFYPKTGALDENGNPERIAFPSYMKDLFHAREDPVKTVTGKLHPLMGLIAEMFQNEDYYGTKIRNEGDPIVRQMKDMAEHVGEAALPFSVRGYQKETERGGSLTKRALPFVGITPAPSYINKSPAEKLMSEKTQASLPRGARTQEAADMSRLRSQLRQKARNGQEIKSEVDVAIKQGKLKPDDAHDILRDAKQTPLQLRYKHLPLKDALEVWDVMTPDERADVKEILADKASSVDDLPETEQPEVRKKLEAIGLKEGIRPRKPREPMQPRKPRKPQGSGYVFQ